MSIPSSSWFNVSYTGRQQQLRVISHTDQRITVNLVTVEWYHRLYNVVAKCFNKKERVAHSDLIFVSAKSIKEKDGERTKPISKDSFERLVSDLNHRRFISLKAELLNNRIEYSATQAAVIPSSAPPPPASPSPSHIQFTLLHPPVAPSPSPAAPTIETKTPLPTTSPPPPTLAAAPPRAQTIPKSIDDYFDEARSALLDCFINIQSQFPKKADQLQPRVGPLLYESTKDKEIQIKEMNQEAKILTLYLAQLKMDPSFTLEDAEIFTGVQDFMYDLGGYSITHQNENMKRIMDIREELRGLIQKMEAGNRENYLQLLSQCLPLITEAKDLQEAPPAAP